MILSQLSSKSQTTIPRAVRQSLNLKPGDAIGYELVGDKVLLSKVDASDPFIANFSTFWEWNTEEDRIGFANL